MRFRHIALAGVAAAVVAYLFDPISGSARRSSLRTRLAPLTSRRPGRLDARTPMPANMAPKRVTQPPDMPEERTTAPDMPEDTPTETMTREVPVSASELPLEAGDRETPDDGTIARTVRSALHQRSDLESENILVDVVSGVAYLRGKLTDRGHFDEIVDLTSSVPGVRRVQSFLRLPESETIDRPVAGTLGDAWNG
jgi:hypothetical protein